MAACIAAGAVALGALSSTASAADQIETRYVADLRAAVADLTAASREVSQLRASKATAFWALWATDPNPGKEPSPPGQTVSATNGHLDRAITEAPQVAFTTDWKPPPVILRPGQKLSFAVTVTGSITGGKDTQGFRTHTAILLKNDSWYQRVAVEVGQHCVDPVGVLPISCSTDSTAEREFTVSAPRSVAGSFSFGIGALNCGPCYYRYEYRAVSRALLVRSAGASLLSAVKRARAVLRRYQAAKYRYGTQEEHELVVKMLNLLRVVGPQYGALARSPVHTTPRRLSVARKLVRAVSKGAARAAVERWPGIDSLAELLRDPRLAGTALKRQITAELTEAIRERASALARKAIDERIPFQLGVPIRTQVRSAVERGALEWLSKALIKLDKRGLLVQFAGKQVRILIRDVALAARSTTKVERRTDITVKGYARHEARLKALIAGPEGAVAPVGAAMDRANGALKAARFLRRDLADLSKRRCRVPTSAACRGVQTTRSKLLAADSRLSRLVRNANQTFLLSRRFDPAELRGWIAGVSRMQSDVSRALTKARRAS